MAGILPHLFNGINLGLLFALISLGFTLIIGVMEVINLTHGSLFALGAYFALTILGQVDIFKSVSSSPSWYYFMFAIMLAPFGIAILGMGVEICMRPTYGKIPLYGLLLTFGASMVIEETIGIIWGKGEYHLSVPEFIKGPFELVKGITYSKYSIFASIFAGIMIFIVWYFINKTKTGSIIKAGAHDSEMVRALGINLKLLRLFVFAFGTALAGIAGIIIAPIWGVRPHMGVDAVIPAFLIVTLGGIGSFWGSVIGGLLVGLVMAMTAAYASEWAMVSIYILLILVVAFRKRGLFGKKSRLDE